MKHMSDPDLPIPPSGVSSVTGEIDRFRYIWFAVIALFLMASFNGQWQIGPDSAAYRQIGHQLATTGRYFFREDVAGLSEYHNKQGTLYPGLPLVLAGLEKLFGPGPLAPLVLMQLLSVLTLILIYRLMLYRIERWAAVCVVVGVGTNPRFLQYANEILSDVPFLLGVVLTLLGYEWIFRAKDRRSLIQGIALIFGGLLIAAAMRPTFMILAVSVMAACLWVMVRGRVGIQTGSMGVSPMSSSKKTKTHGRDAHATGRAVMVLGALIFSILVFRYGLDIRRKQTSGMGSGGYESRMAGKFGDFKHSILARIPENLGEMLEDALPMAFLGFRSNVGWIPMGEHRLGFGAMISLAVIAAGISLAWRNMLWGAFVGVTVVSLAIGGPIPRYFLMILPLLLAGWGLFVHAIAMKVRTPGRATWAMRVGLGLVLVFNLVESCNFALTQRGFSRMVDEHHHLQRLRHVGFLRASHFGQWAGIYDLAKMIHQNVGEQEKILGPEPTILTYLSGRQVYPPHLTVVTPENLKTVFHRALFSVGKSRQSFNEYDDPIAAFELAGKLREGAVDAGPVGGYRLSKIEVPLDRP